MRLSRTHLVPVLAIVAGGVIGASLSFGFLGSRSDDDAPVGMVTDQVTDARLDEVAIAVPAARPCFEQQRISAPPDWVQEPGSSITIRSFSLLEMANPPLFFVDGVRYDAGDCILADLEPDDIEDMDLLMSGSPGAVRRFGEEASNRAIVIMTLTDEARRRR